MTLKLSYHLFSSIILSYKNEMKNKKKLFPTSFMVPSRKTIRQVSFLDSKFLCFPESLAELSGIAVETAAFYSYMAAVATQHDKEWNQSKFALMSHVKNKFV